MGVKNFHVAPPGAPLAWDVRQKNSRKRAPEPLPAPGTLRGAQTSRIQLNKGLVRTKETSISPPATRTHHTPAVPPFHAQRVGNAGGELNCAGTWRFAVRAITGRKGEPRQSGGSMRYFGAEAGFEFERPRPLIE